MPHENDQQAKFVSVCVTAIQMFSSFCLSVSVLRTDLRPIFACIFQGKIGQHLSKETTFSNTKQI